jgi:PTS system nitrogen regulatory IIA component
MLRSPVDFGAPDGAPVGSVFVLVAPTIRAHLDMLARLARALGADLGAAVSARADDETIFAAARRSDRAT